MPTARPYSSPPRRPLKIFAFDPMLGRAAANRVTLNVDNEALVPGPIGAQIEVVDYDAAEQTLYRPVDLDEPSVLMNGGLDPSESDPRFHQQMVYAVTMKVLENFETALGRRLMFRRRKKLRLYPHGFRGANAFYDPTQTAVLFGYFRADEDDPGANLPGQTVFSCLSHDIIAHEVSHALVDRLRPEFMEATNVDVYAFHEAFADIVAIFQHFSFDDVLATTIQSTRSDLRTPNALGELAAQFGYATGGGEALRSTGAGEIPNPRLYEKLVEPHDRGAILVAAVFDAFFNVYQARIADLIRISTGGSGVLPVGNLHPDLVYRIAREASKTARQFLQMSIRAFEYLPPVDVTFGDFLRAIVTADYLTVPGDERGLRAALIEGFRVRGIHPENVTSLAQESLLWEPVASGLKLPFRLSQEALGLNAMAFDRGAERPVPEEVDRKRLDAWAVALKRFARDNAARLGLVPGKPIRLGGFHTLFRVSPDGQLLIELVARFLQQDQKLSGDPAFGGLKLLGGSTVVATSNGTVRYVIAKPLSAGRVEQMRAFVELCDSRDAMLAWGGTRYEKTRMRMQNFANIHRHRPRSVTPAGETL